MLRQEPFQIFPLRLFIHLGPASIGIRGGVSLSKNICTKIIIKKIVVTEKIFGVNIVKQKCENNQHQNYQFISH